MAKAIFITDTHLSPSSVELNKDIFEQVISKAKELGLEKVYHGGDIFDSRKAQPLTVLKSFEEILDRFLEEGLMLIAIPGNHDKNDYNSKDSYLDPFKYHPAFVLYSEYGIEELSKYSDIALLPFFSESGTYSEYLKNLNKHIKEDKRTFLLTHIAVNGVKNNDGSQVENSITEDTFSKYSLVIIGHYHNRSNTAHNIMYMGSAYQSNFGEDSKKGFMLLSETDDGGFETEFIQSHFPEYKKVVLDLNEVTPVEAERLIEDYDTENDNVRFVFKGSYEKINAIDKNKFKRQGVDVKLESLELEVGIIEAQNEEFVSFDKEEIKKEFDSFCDSNEIDNKETGKKYLTQILEK